jgi:metal-sulfur cluster biosynthetic enzyme
MSEDGPKLIWEIDSTHPIKAEEVRQALRQVMDPELGMSIIELGLVRDVSMDDDHLEVKMILTTPFCPYGPALLESARGKTEEVAEVPTTIELANEMWDPSMMEDSTAAEWGLF